MCAPSSSLLHEKERNRLLEMEADRRERENKIVHVGGLRAFFELSAQPAWSQRRIAIHSQWKQLCAAYGNEARYAPEQPYGWLRHPTWTYGADRTCIICGNPVSERVIERNAHLSKRQMPSVCDECQADDVHNFAEYDSPIAPTPERAPELSDAEVLQAQGARVRYDEGIEWVIEVNTC
jgi:hypothetical protein